jgi:hypothetical protein
MLGLLLILISKSWGGGGAVSPTFLSVGVVFILEVFSQASS